MFTGIIEAQSNILEARLGDHSIRILLERPSDFDDLKPGDSIACNGVCLTVEAFDETTISMTIGHETLLITGWDPQSLMEKPFNLERSLRFGDRVHGHIVSGHVDGRSTLLDKKWEGDCLVLEVAIPQARKAEIWKKSSVTLNGVSLTVNDVSNDCFQVCLIPETLKKTNLEKLEPGDPVNLETDYYMKGLLNARDIGNA